MFLFTYRNKNSTVSIGIFIIMNGYELQWIYNEKICASAQMCRHKSVT